MNAWLVDRDDRFRITRTASPTYGASRRAGSGARIRLDAGVGIWAIITVLLALGELATPGLFLGPVARRDTSRHRRVARRPGFTPVLLFILGALAARRPAPDREHI
jgi:hypothetical protein